MYKYEYHLHVHHDLEFLCSAVPLLVYPSHSETPKKRVGNHRDLQSARYFDAFTAHVRSEQPERWTPPNSDYSGVRRIRIALSFHNSETYPSEVRFHGSSGGPERSGVEINFS